METLDYRPSLNTIARIIQSPKDPNKDSCEFIIELAPNESGPPAHIHPTQVEVFKVLEGEPEFLVNGKWKKLNPGETVEVPINTIHTFRNIGSSWIKLSNFHIPDMGFEAMMRELHDLVKSGKVTSSKDLKSIIHVSMLWVKYRELQVAVNPLGIAMKILAGVGKLLGYKL